MGGVFSTQNYNVFVNGTEVVNGDHYKLHMRMVRFRIVPKSTIFKLVDFGTILATCRTVGLD